VPELASTTCLTSRGIEPAAIFRRAVGLGLTHAATEIELEDVLAYMKARTTSYVVPVAPHSQPAALPTWLERHGFKRGYAWMKFRRACTGAPRASAELEIRVAGPQLGGEFGRVIAEGFGLPRSLIPRIGALAGRPNSGLRHGFFGRKLKLPCSCDVSTKRRRAAPRSRSPKPARPCPTSRAALTGTSCSRIRGDVPAAELSVALNRSKGP
jgi:hypothetical protein